MTWETDETDSFWDDEDTFEAEMISLDIIVIPLEDWDPDFFAWLIAENEQDKLLDSVLFGGDGSEQIEHDA